MSLNKTHCFQHLLIIIDMDVPWKFSKQDLYHITQQLRDDFCFINNLSSKFILYWPWWSHLFYPLPVTTCFSSLHPHFKPTCLWLAAPNRHKIWTVGVGGASGQPELPAWSVHDDSCSHWSYRTKRSRKKTSFCLTGITCANSDLNTWNFGHYNTTHL